MLAETLRDYRRAHGLKQDALAYRLGVSQATVSRWEKGAADPTLSQRRRIVDLIGSRNGLSPSTRSMIQVHLDPNPCNLSANEIWTVCNPAARASFLGEYLNYIGTEILHLFHPRRIAMVAEGRNAVMRCEVVAAECVAPCFDAANNRDFDGYHLHSRDSYMVCDGVKFTTTRFRVLTEPQLRAAGLREGYSFTALDEVLAGAM